MAGMNAYLVRYRVTRYMYVEGGMVSDGYYVDFHNSMVVTASSHSKARAIVRAALDKLYPEHKSVVYQPEWLLDA